MFLKENERVFHDYRWTVDNVNIQRHVKLVSPEFGFDGIRTIFRLSARFANSNGFFDKCQTIVCLTVRDADYLGIDIQSVECTVGNKTIHLSSANSSAKRPFATIQLFRSEELAIRRTETGDSFTISCRIEMSNSSKGIHHSRTCGFQLADANFPSPPPHSSADCQFEIANRVFPAHYAIVSARSRLLAQSIRQGRAKVANIHPEAFNMLLHFLYTGRVLLSGHDRDIRRQFDVLARHYRIKSAPVLLPELLADDTLAQWFSSDIQPLFKSDAANLEIKENEGVVSLVDRGLCLRHDYVRSSVEDSSPEVFRFGHQQGFFAISLTENDQNNNKLNYLLTLSCCQLPSGFQLVKIDYYLNDQSTFSQLPELFNRKGHIRLFRDGIALPAGSNCIHLSVRIDLKESYDGWGYRLHDPRLPADYWSMINNKFSDVQLIVAGRKSFGAHRAVLSARSAVFERILACGKVTEIQIKYPDPDVFEDFLVFVYTGRLRRTDRLAELWPLAKEFQVETLEKITESAMDVPNVEESIMKMLIRL